METTKPFTSFELLSKIELCREWHNVMETSNLATIESDTRFLQLCHELDNRHIGPRLIAEILAGCNYG